MFSCKSSHANRCSSVCVLHFLYYFLYHGNILCNVCITILLLQYHGFVSVTMESSGCYMLPWQQFRYHSLQDITIYCHNGLLNSNELILNRIHKMY
mgnify:CR=1 FL=1